MEPERDEPVTECPFYIPDDHGCNRENGPTQCYVNRRDNYTMEQNEQNDYKIGDMVLVHFYKMLVPGIVVHRRGKWGCKVMFADSSGRTRCSNAVIHILVGHPIGELPTTDKMMEWVKDRSLRQKAEGSKYD